MRLTPDRAKCKPKHTNPETKIVPLFSRLATSLFLKSPRQTHSTARDLSAGSSKERWLRRTNLLINIHDCANPTSLFPLPSFFPHFDFAGAWVLACWWVSGNRLVASLVIQQKIRFRVLSFRFSFSSMSNF